MASNDEIVLSQADMNNLNTVSDIQIFVNVSSVNDVCSQWQSKIDGLNIDVDKIASTFKPLTDYGILVNYVTGLASAIASLLQSVKTVTTTIANSSNSHNDSENGINTDGDGGNYNYVGGGSQYSGGNYSGGDNGDQDLGIDPSDRIDSISFQDYLGLSTLLYTILKENNIGFDSITDDTVFEKVKTLILSSNFLSAELKEKLTKYSDTNLKEMLKLMVQNGTFENFTVSNVNFIEDYFTKLAKMNNNSVTDYLGSSTNKSVVYNDMYYLNNALTYIETASKNKDFNTILQNILDGKDADVMGSKNITAIRNVISLVASKNNKTPEEYVKSANVSDFKDAISSGYLVNDLVRGNTDELQNILLTLIK